MCMEMEGSDALKCIQSVKKVMKKRERVYLSDIGINAQIKLLLIDCRRNLDNDMMPIILLPVISVSAY